MGTPAEVEESRNVAIWLLLEVASLRAPLADGTLDMAHGVVDVTVGLALRDEEAILLDRKFRRAGMMALGIRRTGALLMVVLG